MDQLSHIGHWIAGVPKLQSEILNWPLPFINNLIRSGIKNGSDSNFVINNGWRSIWWFNPSLRCNVKLMPGPGGLKLEPSELVVCSDCFLSVQKPLNRNNNYHVRNKDHQKACQPILWRCFVASWLFDEPAEAVWPKTPSSHPEQTQNQITRLRKPAPPPHAEATRRLSFDLLNR